MLLKETILIVTVVVPVDLPSFVIFIARFPLFCPFPFKFHVRIIRGRTRIKWCCSVTLNTVPAACAAIDFPAIFKRHYISPAACLISCRRHQHIPDGAFSIFRTFLLIKSLGASPVSLEAISFSGRALVRSCLSFRNSSIDLHTPGWCGCGVSIVSLLNSADGSREKAWRHNRETASCTLTCGFTGSDSCDLIVVHVEPLPEPVLRVKTQDFCHFPPRRTSVFTQNIWKYYSTVTTTLNTLITS